MAQGLIYVWPEAGPQADAEAWSTKPHLLPWIDEKVRVLLSFVGMPQALCLCPCLHDAELPENMEQWTASVVRIWTMHASSQDEHLSLERRQ